MVSLLTRFDDGNQYPQSLHLHIFTIPIFVCLNPARIIHEPLHRGQDTPVTLATSRTYGLSQYGLLHLGHLRGERCFSRGVHTCPHREHSQIVTIHLPCIQATGTNQEFQEGSGFPLTPLHPGRRAAPSQFSHRVTVPILHLTESGYTATARQRSVPLDRFLTGQPVHQGQ